MCKAEQCASCQMTIYCARPFTVQAPNPKPCMCSYRLSEQLSALGEAATGGVPGGQEGSSEDMSGLVDGIMHQLLAKDVLYQPIQEIGARYPQWLADHRYTTWVWLFACYCFYCYQFYSFSFGFFSFEHSSSSYCSLPENAKECAAEGYCRT